MPSPFALLRSRSLSQMSVAAIVITVGVAVTYTAATDQPAAGSPNDAAGPALASTDLSSMSPRQAADRLFDRVMRAVGGGDVAEIRTFLPMAIAAYAQVDSLGPDGAFHLAMLQRVAEQHSDALETSSTALAHHPDHLLALSEASEAALALGDTASAQTYARRLIAAYARETRRTTVPDYDFHRNILPDLYRRAEVVSALVPGSRAG